MLKPDPLELPWTRPSVPPQKCPAKVAPLRQVGRAPCQALPPTASQAAAKKSQTSRLRCPCEPYQL